MPLDPEVLSKTKQGDITVEQVRYTSLPGVRVVMTLTYKEGAKGAPGYEFVELFPIPTQIAQADSGFVGIFISPPTGNKDPKKIESVGGPVYASPFNFNAQFLPDRNNSYIYQYTVAMLRGFDYLATRPEVNLAATTVTGYAWASTMICLLHALDDRPAAYIVFHAPGYYVNEQGLSAGKPFVLYNNGATPVMLTRKLYEMYCPAAYAQYGTKPIYIGSALDDAYTKLDAIIEMTGRLKAPKVLAFAPNRHLAATSRNEFNGFTAWMSSWVFSGEKPSTIGEGTVKASNGKVTYQCAVDSKVPLTHAELLVSYGKPGNWLGRTWHRITLTQTGSDCTGEIPVYDPHVPFYAIAQVETAKFGAVANRPQFVDPLLQGVTASNAAYPSTLFDPSAKDDLYFRVGSAEWSPEGPDGKGSAIVTPGAGNVITFQNVDAMLWAGKKSLSIWLKGDGLSGPIRAYLVHGPNYYFEPERKNFATVDLVSAGAKFASGWNEYSIPLSKIPNLAEVSNLVFDTQKRKLQIGPIILKP